jgi:hypothetical protein
MFSRNIFLRFNRLSIKKKEVFPISFTRLWYNPLPRLVLALFLVRNLKIPLLLSARSREAREDCDPRRNVRICLAWSTRVSTKCRNSESVLARIASRSNNLSWKFLLSLSHTRTRVNTVNSVNSIGVWFVSQAWRSSNNRISFFPNQLSARSEASCRVGLHIRQNGLFGAILVVTSSSNHHGLSGASYVKLYWFALQ